MHSIFNICVLWTNKWEDNKSFREGPFKSIKEAYNFSHTVNGQVEIAIMENNIQWQAIITDEGN